MKNKQIISKDIKQLTNDVKTKRIEIIKATADLKLDKIKNIHTKRNLEKDLARLLTALNAVEPEEMK